MTGDRRWIEVPADEASEAIVASMKLAGIDRFWFVSGSELSFFQEAAAKAQALGRHSPRLMTMVDERPALAMAAGETMVSGKPSAVVAHVDLGLLNMGGGIHNARHGNYPVLMMSGFAPTAYPGSMPGAKNGWVQWIQQLSDYGEIVRQYVKWDWKLTGFDNVGLVITRAVQVMTTPPVGPGYLALPREAGRAPLPGVACFPTLDALRPGPPAAADPLLVRQAAHWLLEAEMPLITTDRAGRDRRCAPPLLELIELLGAYAQSDLFRMSVPDQHPQRRGIPSRAPIPSGVDLVLAIDSVVPWMPGEFDVPRDARVIAIGTDPVHSTLPIYDFPADLSITGDSLLALPALLEEVRRQITPEQRRRCDARRERICSEGRQIAEQRHWAAEKNGAGPLITPLWLSYQLGQALAPDVIVAHELCDMSMINRTEPGTLFTGGGAHIGWAAPAAVGARVAMPERTVVAAVGDGSWIFSNPQAVLWGAQYHKAPLLVVVFNNRGYSTGTEIVRREYPEGYAARDNNYEGGWFDPPPNFAGEALANGCYGEKVTTPDQVRPAVERALNVVTRDGASAVLDMWLPKLVTGDGPSWHS